MKAILLILLILTGISATTSGILFILHPTGASFGLSPAVLSSSPFSDFRVPGIILALVGLVHVAAVLLVVVHTAFRYELAAIAGILLCGWIIGQMALLRMMNGWQISFLLIGLITILSAYELKKSTPS